MQVSAAAGAAAHTVQAGPQRVLGPTCAKHLGPVALHAGKEDVVIVIYIQPGLPRVEHLQCAANMMEVRQGRRGEAAGTGT